ncbi:MAG TPA: glutamine--fructose-6-phosphate transaminase (isomerizing) [Acidimicrobiales bacterium]|nr:glutamine--fructose-6-phosphate transaminase (isomerizing) [Acidimicrobiales bacterium]
MCGIIGVTGTRDAQTILLEGLARLEYRGYDSAGVALTDEGVVWRARAATSTTSLVTLGKAVHELPEGLRCGIGHTRWATHGAPTEPNAHPHMDCTGQLALVHNGIVENYKEIGKPLYAEGHAHASETDTEALAHLIESEMATGVDLPEAVRRACRVIQGDFAIAAVHASTPDLIVAARRTSPLIIGRADGVGLLASDISALIGTSETVWQLEDDQVAVITPAETVVTDLDGELVIPAPIEVNWDLDAAQKGGYPDFMSKEIHEQPRALADTLLGRLHGMDTDLEELVLDDEALRNVRRVVLVACGSSLNAALVARNAIEAWARVPAEVEIASEFRYRSAVLDEGTLVVAISQSGESVDTFHALREGQRRGAHTVALTNVVDSLMAREADGVLYTRAGPEIGVASTKCHTAQLVLLQVFALHLARVRGTLSGEEIARLSAEISALPALVSLALDREGEYAAVAHRYADVHDFFFLGRNIGYPVALEGALKLKELAYVRAEAYAAGEMKHGPIALIEPGAVVVAMANRGPLWEKVMANIAEMKARGATIVSLCDEGDEETAAVSDAVLAVPPSGPVTGAVVSVVPLQVFAYAIATARGNDVDRPRNLAKVVTVE